MKTKCDSAIEGSNNDDYLHLIQVTKIYGRKLHFQISCKIPISLLSTIHQRAIKMTLFHMNSF